MTSGCFSWVEDELWFEYRERSGSHWLFSGFKTGRYLIEMTYKNLHQVWEQWGQWSSSIDLRPQYQHGTTGRSEIAVKDVWVGEVAMPPMEFCLIDNSINS
ncbi:hypothetical protein [Phormidesmis priestleyi]